MKKIFIIMLFLMGFTTFSYAGNCDNLTISSNVSETVLIELKRKCLELTKETNGMINSNQMQEYAEIGKKYGIALSEVAKSVGVTVNELAQTPVGIFMLVMVGYKVLGQDLIGIFGSVIWFITMIPLWIYMFHRLIFSTRQIKEIYSEGKLKEKNISPICYCGHTIVICIIMLVILFFICVSGFAMAFG